MSSIKLFLLIICVSFYSSRVSGAVSEKILVLNSYSQDYKWSNSIVDSIGIVLKNHYPDAELIVEYLSAERVTDCAIWVDRINLLFDSYSDKKLSAIIIVSDEAWMAYRAAKKVEGFANVPLFLCAVKPHSISLDRYNKAKAELKLTDFELTQDLMKQYSATGILQEINIKGSFDLMHRVIPDIKNYTIITDGHFYGIYTRLMIENYLLKIRSDLPVEYICEHKINTDSMLIALSKIDSKSGVLFTSWYAEDSSYAYSKTYVQDEICNTTEAPIFVTSDQGIASKSFIGGYYNHNGFWGEKVANMVVQSLSGGGFSNLEYKIIKDDRCNINWESLSRFDIRADNLDEDTHYINRPESIFVKYYLQFIFGSIAVLFLVMVNIYVIKKNIKLKKAQKKAASAIEESKSLNRHLVEMQASLKEALERAEESDRLKSAFIGSLDHEIRAPLNLIVGFSSIISSIEDREDIENAANQIYENSEKLLNLIKNILDLSHLESGSADFNYEKVDVDGVFKDLIPSYNKKLKNGVSIKYNKPEKSICLITEPVRVLQVLSNFIDNAVKFTTIGVVEVGYFVVDDQWVEFYVKDSGVGISDDEVDKVFDRFYKFHSYSVGSGLGLSVSKIIIKTLGGTIGVSSQLGIGSRFWFRIENTN